MARKKRTSADLMKARVRLARLRSIEPALDLGNGLTIAAYEKAVKDLTQLLDDYNAALAKLDQMTTAVREMERQLRSFSSKMLSGVACKFGRNSDEYEMAGGTRQLERQRIPSSLLKAKADMADGPDDENMGPMMPAPTM